LSAESLDSLRTFVHELAAASGDFIRPFFKAPNLAVEIKSDASPVTEADRGAEKQMRERIERRFPHHGIMGEEFGLKDPDAEWVWVLDPIDGTKAFAAGCPLFGTLIAVLHHGEPLLGAIHQPVLGELMVGDGTTTTLNGRPTRMRSCAKIEDAVLLTSDPYNPGKYRNGAAYEQLARRARVARTWGDCYGYLLLASGWADIMLDPIMNPWDIPALVPIIRGAGGIITDWYGGSAVKADSTVATGPALHAEVIAALR
jgi:myo-inositol-1(or 4)-monophosphatase